VPTLPPPLASRTPPPIDVASAPARLHLETSSGTAAWIGPEGGKLTAAAGDGTSYELDIPALAVREPTPITMTPVGAVDGLGLSGGTAGAVYLGPTGLRLAEPAILTISSAKPAPSGTRLVGFDIADDGKTTELVPATVGSGSVAVLVFHFSAPGAGYGTTTDLQQLAPRAAGGTWLSDLVQLLAADVPWDLTTSGSASRIITAAWSTSIFGVLSNASSDDALLDALADWREFVFLLNLSAHHGDVTAALAEGVQLADQSPSFVRVIYNAGLDLVVRRIGNAIDGNRTLCNQSRDLHALANIVFWSDLSQTYSPSPSGSGPVSTGCATIQIGTFNPASNLRAGTTDTLQLALVLAFTDGTQLPGDFAVNLQASNFTFTSSNASTADTGEVGSQLLVVGASASADPPYVLTASACWSLDGLPRDLCSGPMSRPFGAGATPPIPTPSGSAPPGDFILLAGTLSPVTVNTCSVIQVLATDRGGHQLTDPVQWSATGPVRQLLPNGSSVQVLTGSGLGTITVVAIVNGKRASIDITVTKNPSVTC
jgi:hypothetical protein